MNTNLSHADIKELKEAKQILENPGLAAVIMNYFGKPLEKGFERLPEDVNSKIGKITQAALLKAAEGAIFTMKKEPGTQSWNKLHKLGAFASGGVGGFFGLVALPIELPISTGIILRSIAETARAQGESISDQETKLACLTVLALGGPSKEDNATESGYYTVRTVLAQSVSAASKHMLTKGLAEDGAPVLIKLLTNIAQRFSIQVSEKVAAQAIPLVGAAGGALINTLFMDHFQDMAKGHFIVRKLERKYGSEVIQREYEQI
ncbi:EcsC family protein [Salinimicrobium sp. TIG7-5_MAKvit]|uniref:EcsC family protein n=1 Tax=Salinimicrobium sp. TIG7-5_MAKvit TaxID=3121289 RepID=UPI003C6E433B